MQNYLIFDKKKVDKKAKIRLFALKKEKRFVLSRLTKMEGWQSGQMQRTVNPSTLVYDGSNPSPSTI